MRLPHVLFLLLSALPLLPLLTNCRSAEDDGVYVISLSDTLRTAGAGYKQLYWGVGDTAAWEATVAAADTIAYPDTNSFKMRSAGIWYVARIVDGGLRAAQPYPGWERMVDTVNRSRNIVRLLDNKRVLVTIPSAQVKLGDDAITIALVRVLQPAFQWQEASFESRPDYLMLLPAEADVAYVAMDAGNIGPITEQTVFRVGRKFYALTNLADDYGSLTVQQLPGGLGIPPTAELETKYKSVAVKDLSDSLTTIQRTPGRELAVYFFALGGTLPEYVLELDSTYRSLPPEEQADVDIALVCRWAFPDSIRAFVNRHDIQLPVYQQTEKTCRRLNCTSALPAIVSVDERGRILTYHGQHDGLIDRILPARR